MITRETATKIAHAHAEITAARELLVILDKNNEHRGFPDLRDAFGSRQHGLQLGVPSGTIGHRLYEVTPELARYVIEAHVGKMQGRLVELCTMARMELDGLVEAQS